MYFSNFSVFPYSLPLGSDLSYLLIHSQHSGSLALLTNVIIFCCLKVFVFNPKNNFSLTISILAPSEGVNKYILLVYPNSLSLDGAEYAPLLLPCRVAFASMKLDSQKGYYLNHLLLFP